MHTVNYLVENRLSGISIYTNTYPFLLNIVAAVFYIISGLLIQAEINVMYKVMPRRREWQTEGNTMQKGMPCRLQKATPHSRECNAEEKAMQRESHTEANARQQGTPCKRECHAEKKAM